MSICFVDTTWVLLPSPLRMLLMPTRPMPTWGWGVVGDGGRVRGGGVHALAQTGVMAAGKAGPGQCVRAACGPKGLGCKGPQQGCSLNASQPLSAPRAPRSRGRSPRTAQQPMPR